METETLGYEVAETILTHTSHTAATTSDVTKNLTAIDATPLVIGTLTDSQLIRTDDNGESICGKIPEQTENRSPIAGVNEISRAYSEMNALSQQEQWYPFSPLAGDDARADTDSVYDAPQISESKYKFMVHNRTLFAMGIVLGVVLLAYFWWNHTHTLSRNNPNLLTEYPKVNFTSSTANTELKSASSVSDSAQIIVSIVGLIAKPGLYHVDPTNRIADLIHRAGPILIGGTLKGLNRAEFVEDGEQIVITSSQSESYVEYSDGRGHRININTASVQALSKVPGISHILAITIVQYRKLHGKFQQISDLTNVTGIKQAKLAKIEPYLLCEP